MNSKTQVGDMGRNGFRSIDSLSDEILLKIFSCVEKPTNLFSYRMVCKKWHNLTKDNMLWRQLFMRDFLPIKSFNKKNINKKRFNKQYSSLKQSEIKWERLYLRNHCFTYGPLGVVDLTENYNKETIVPGIYPAENTKKRLVTVLNSKIFAFQSNLEILVWSLTDGTYIDKLCLKDINSNYARAEVEISCLVSSEKENLLFIGFNNGTLDIYKLENKRELKRKFTQDKLNDKQKETINMNLVASLEPGIINKQEDKILDIQTLTPYLAILYETGAMELWRMPEFLERNKWKQSKVNLIKRFYNLSSSKKPISMELSNILKESQIDSFDAVLKVSFDVMLLGGNHEVALQEFYLKDGTVSNSVYHTTVDTSNFPERSYIDLDDEISDRFISNPIYNSIINSTITCITYTNLQNTNIIVSGHTDHTINIWHIMTVGIRHLNTFTGHTGAITCLAIDSMNSNRLISGSNDRQLKVWSLISGSCLLTLTGHHSPLSGIANKENLRLISGDIQGRWKLWCFDT